MLHPTHQSSSYKRCEWRGAMTAAAQTDWRTGRHKNDMLHATPPRVSSCTFALLETKQRATYVVTYFNLYIISLIKRRLRW